MNKLNVIENTCTKEKPLIDKSIIKPIVIGVVCLGMLYWTVSHIAGGCTNLADVIKVCSFSIR